MAHAAAGHWRARTSLLPRPDADLHHPRMPRCPGHDIALESRRARSGDLRPLHRRLPKEQVHAPRTGLRADVERQLPATARGPRARRSNSQRPALTSIGHHRKRRRTGRCDGTQPSATVDESAGRSPAHGTELSKLGSHHQTPVRARLLAPGGAAWRTPQLDIGERERPCFPRPDADLHHPRMPRCPGHDIALESRRARSGDLRPLHRRLPKEQVHTPRTGLRADVERQLPATAGARARRSNSQRPALAYRSPPEAPPDWSM